MDPEDITIEVRSVSLGRLGQIDMELVNDFKAIKRFNNVGSWSMSLPAEDSMAQTLAQPGRGLIVTGPYGVLLSGPVTSFNKHEDTDDLDGTISFIGADDNVHLGDALAFPDPLTADPAVQKFSNDIRTGNAESVIRQYVAFNIGDPDSMSPPSTVWGYNDRKIPGLGLQAVNGNQGATVTGNARFDQLGKLIGDIAAAGGVGFDIKQTTTSKKELQIYVPTDKSAYIRMDIQNDLLDATDYGFGSPTGTRFIVAGQGDGTLRTIIQTKTTTTAEADWGRKVEVFKDRRDTNDPVQLTQDGVAGVTDNGKTITSLSVTPSDNVTMVYARDWFIGDKVAVVVDGQELKSIVTEAIISITADGVTTAATIGDPVGFDFESKLIDNQISQDARIAFLEKNSEVGLDSGSSGTRNSTFGTPTTALARLSLAMTQPIWHNTDTGRSERYYMSLSDANGDPKAMANASEFGAGWYTNEKYKGCIGRYADMMGVMTTSGVASYATVALSPPWAGMRNDVFMAVRTLGGIVQLSGLMVFTAAKASTTVLGVLPPGYRPDNTLIVQTNQSDTAGSVLIFPDGTIQAQSAITAGQYVAFDNVSFPAAGVATWTNIDANGTAGSDHTFQNGWVAYGITNGAVPRYWKDPNTGITWLDGYVTNPTAARWVDGNLMFTLPLTHQAFLQQHYVACANSGFGFVGTQTNGPVTLTGGVVFKGAAGATTGWVSLSCIKMNSTDSLTKLAWWKPTGAYANSWLDYNAAAFSDFRLGKAPDGMVYSMGLVRTGTIASKIAQPPEAYQQEHRTLRAACSNSARGRMDMRGFKDWEVYTTSWSPGCINPNQGANNWFSFDNQCWFADAPLV